MIGERLGRRAGHWRRSLLALALVLLLLGAFAAPAPALAATSPLLERQALWPQWTLPAPVARPGRRDLVLPEWMLGRWELHEWELRDGNAAAWPADPDSPERDRGGISTPPENAQSSGAPVPPIMVRFVADRRGRVVGDRAFNALNLGRSVLGDSLLGVENDPGNPNRQLARLRGDRLLESTVIGRRSVSPDAASLLADELTLQILHGPGQPQISQVEVLALYRRQGDDVTIEQWQASYGAPGDAGEARRSSHRLLLLQRSPEG